MWLIIKRLSYNFQSHTSFTLKIYVNSKYAIKNREDAISTRPPFASILTEKCPNGNIGNKEQNQEASLEPIGHPIAEQAQGLKQH